jgi:hypothetical protein
MHNFVILSHAKDLLFPSSLLCVFAFLSVIPAREAAFFSRLLHPLLLHHAATSLLMRNDS